MPIRCCKIHASSALVAAAALAMHSSAQPLVVDPNHGFTWAENIGFCVWPASPQGPRFFRNSGGGFFTGFIWNENAGWINLGRGGGPYANLDGASSGVNADQSGRLSGFAWSENCGWINFAGGAIASFADGARIEASGRLRGFAWAENAGWINLDDANVYVAFIPGCPADFNRDTLVDDSDFLLFVIAYNALDCPPANACPYDLTGDAFVGDDDFQVFLVSYDELLCS